ncbi:hypothetical protein ES708_18998 [subsurface metagenome]
MSRMFPFITKTWNPLAGKCSHECVGCWAAAFAHRHKFSKYQGDPRIDPGQINRRFEKGDFVFVQTMSDLFAENVPREMILRVLESIKKSPDARFLLLTKNPKRYKSVLEFIPKNCVCGATIETDLDNDLANAPSRIERIEAMEDLEYKPKMVSVEPIRYFTVNFFGMLVSIEPEFIAAGYDNYGNNFHEPRLVVTKALINAFEAYGIKVYRKTLRECKKIDRG